MTELRFHREVYLGTAVDEAVKRYAPYAHFDLAEEPEHWVVKLAARSASLEGRVAGELGNYALGLTVKNRSTQRGNP